MPEGKVKFGFPKTDALYFKLRERFPHSSINAGPVLQELWAHAAMMERDLAQCKDVRNKYPQWVRIMRATARKLGYAIAVHGTLGRDVDVVAIPWEKDAVGAHTLAKAMGLALEGHIERGHAGHNPILKPHGRLAWVIHLKGGAYVDLSVVPRRSTQKLDVLAAWARARRDRVRVQLRMFRSRVRRLKENVMDRLRKDDNG